MTSQKEFVDNVKICEPLGFRDYDQIHVIIKVKEERIQKYNTRKMSTMEDIRKYLAKIDWNNTLRNILNSEIDCIAERFVP